MRRGLRNLRNLLFIVLTVLTTRVRPHHGSFLKGFLNGRMTGAVEGRSRVFG